MFGVILVALLIIRLYQKRKIKFLLVIMSIYWALSTPVLSNNLIKILEIDNDDNTECIQSLNKSKIVVLGGGLKSGKKIVNLIELLSAESLARTLGARYLFGRLPDAEIIISGGYSEKYSEAQLMKMLLIDLGVEDNLIKVDGRSINTYQNAINVKQILTDDGWDDKVVLVTSAYHMPRAAAVFKKQNIETCGYSVDYKTMQTRYEYAWIPQMRSMQVLKYYLHEKIGYMFYKLSGYI